jgi:hypothetical protein
VLAVSGVALTYAVQGGAAAQAACVNLVMDTTFLCVVMEAKRVPGGADAAEAERERALVALHPKGAASQRAADRGGRSSRAGMDGASSVGETSGTNAAKKASAAYRGSGGGLPRGLGPRPDATNGRERRGLVTAS